MSDPKSPKPPGSRPPAAAGAAPGAPRTPSARGDFPDAPGATGSSPARPGSAGPTGKVSHDHRGNAIWDWLKETSRHAIESTSRLLRRLDVPELKMEDKKDEELRLMDDDAGGGYDPYNQRQTRPPRK